MYESTVSDWQEQILYVTSLHCITMCMSLSPWPPFVPSSPPRPCVVACSPGLAVLRWMTVRMCRRSRRTHQAASSLLPPQSASKIWQTTHSKKKKKKNFYFDRKWSGSWTVHRYWYINMHRTFPLCILMFNVLKNCRNTHNTHVDTQGTVGEWLHDLTIICPPCSVQAVQCSVPGLCLQPSLHSYTHAALYCGIQQNTQMVCARQVSLNMMRYLKYSVVAIWRSEWVLLKNWLHRTSGQSCNSKHNAALKFEYS